MMNTFKFGLALSLVLAACAGGHNGDDDDDGPGGDASIPACEPTSGGSYTFEKIANWRDDVTAAYSMVHDDMCGPALQGIVEQAVPALKNAGLAAGLAPIVEQCELNGLWDQVKDAERLGNEIVNHSYTHPEVNGGNAQHEIADAKAAFEQHTENPVTFYVFPYDYFTADTIAVVKSSGHFGARAGNRDDNNGEDMPPINTADPTNDFEAEFDVWPRNYSKYALWFPEEILTVHAYNAIERKGWALREFHSVIADGSSPTDQGFGPITRTQYDKHLAFLAAAWRKGVLWTAPPSTVIRYRHAKTACKASVSGEVIKFDTSNPDCVKFATPISVIIKTGDDVVRVDGSQGMTQVETRKLGPGRFSVTADPTKGDVTLSACSNRGHEVDPETQLAPKPPQAPSVCLIETVRGTGSPGRMDDLERPDAEFQVLPNPRQADGRTGSWSWYPQNAQVAIRMDGSNRVLRYAGNNIARWTGATLAFLGGNGAGSCYDASVYRGIRFRIKGSVTSSDELNGKVILSVISAKTQTRSLGGDLMGEGGHFNKVITLTSTWQTVSVTWAELNRPTWGATTGEMAVAKDKLQALDWGVSNMASQFEIFIDDVELY